MYTIVLVIHVFLAIALTGLILIQHGKGADAGAAFGAGASGTVFGAAGASSFLSRTTYLFATFFVVTSLTLAYFIKDAGPSSVIEDIALMEVESDVPSMDALPEVSAPATDMSEADVPSITVTPTTDPVSDSQ